MNCSKCGARMRVTDTRSAPKGLRRRRRVCPHCGHRATSYEVVVEEGETLLVRAGMGEGVFDLVEVGRVRGAALYCVGSVRVAEVGK